MLFLDIQGHLNDERLCGGTFAKRAIVLEINPSRSRGFGSLLRIEWSISGSSGSISKSSFRRDTTIF